MKLAIRIFALAIVVTGSIAAAVPPTVARAIPGHLSATGPLPAPKALPAPFCVPGYPCQ